MIVGDHTFYTINASIRYAGRIFFETLPLSSIPTITVGRD